MTPLILPGLNGSGHAHWQTWLGKQLATSTRVEQPDWAVADLDRWAAVLRTDVLTGRGDALIIAHSFGCLAAIDVVQSGCPHVGAALLVAPADPSRFEIPDARLAKRLAIPAILVASRNDPWMSFERATFWSRQLGCWLFDAGCSGHINVASGHGPWPDALDLVAALARPSRSDGQRRPTDRAHGHAHFASLGISNPENDGWGRRRPVLLPHDNELVRSDRENTN